MNRKLWRRPSPALAVSIVALVLAASGSAVAASKLVSGNSLIRKNSLSGNRLKAGSVTGKQIQASTLGTVPNATSANTATTAQTATTAVTATTAMTATTAESSPISKVTYVSQPWPITGTPAAGVNVVANCPAGTVVIGGGAQVASEADGYVNDSYPMANKSGWVANFQGDNNPNTGTVTAICAPAAATAP